VELPSANLLRSLVNDAQYESPLQRGRLRLECAGLPSSSEMLPIHHCTSSFISNVIVSHKRSGQTQGIYLGIRILVPPLDQGGGLPDKCDILIELWPTNLMFWQPSCFASAKIGRTVDPFSLHCGPVDLRVYVSRKPTEQVFIGFFPSPVMAKLRFAGGIAVNCHET